MAQTDLLNIQARRTYDRQEVWDNPEPQQKLELAHICGANNEGVSYEYLSNRHNNLVCFLKSEQLSEKIEPSRMKQVLLDPERKWYLNPTMLFRRSDMQHSVYSLDSFDQEQDIGGEEQDHLELMEDKSLSNAHFFDEMDVAQYVQMVEGTESARSSSVHGGP